MPKFRSITQNTVDPKHPQYVSPFEQTRYNLNDIKELCDTWREETQIRKVELLALRNSSSE